MKKTIFALLVTLITPNILLAKEKIYSVNGVVLKIDKENNEIGIKHETIKGYMEAMAMIFTVEDKKILEGIEIGDSIVFKLKVKDGEDKIIEIKRKKDKK